ncbi:MAG: XdhC family protein [Anaerolineales bacterium]
MNDDFVIFEALANLKKENQAAALCTVIHSEGSTPRHVGSKMLVFADGRFIGSIGGGDLEHRVLDEAWIAIVEGKPRRLRYNMVDPQRGDPGVCGGTVEIFVEPILPPPLLVVVGGGHVGKAVAHLAKWLGFRVVVSDDRPEYCTPEAVPDADAFYPCPLSELPKWLPITRNTYLVLTTRGSGIDVEGLPALLETPAAYIGVIGSKRRWLTTVNALREKGISEEKLARVRSPVGLEIHAETPEEIAISILAEIIMLRRGGSGQPMAYSLQSEKRERAAAK